MVSDTEPSKESSGSAPNALRYLSGGLEFAVICTAGVLGGRWIDARLGTEPIFMVVLVLVAFAAGLWRLLSGLLASDDDTGDERSSTR